MQRLRNVVDVRWPGDPYLSSVLMLFLTNFHVDTVMCLAKKIIGRMVIRNLASGVLQHKRPRFTSSDSAFIDMCIYKYMINL